MFRVPILSLVLCLFALTSLSAQGEYGHLNFANLLADLPETAAAEAELKALNDTLMAQGLAEVRQLEADVADLEAKSAELAPVKVAQERQRLEKVRESIIDFERNMAVEIERKRKQLLQPIITRVREVVAEVAREGNYLMVFDTSIFNSVLYAEDSQDLMPAVLAKLGL